MLRSLWRNLWQAVPTIFVIVTLGFLLLQLAPGDAADYLAAEAGAATAENMEALRKIYGLDLPVLRQLLNYYGNLAHLSLGYSPRYGAPVLDIILGRLPNTLLLLGVSIGVALALGVAAGTAMALRTGRGLDRLLSLPFLLFYSVPVFWTGLVLIVLFSVQLGWLPTGGAASIGTDLSGWALIADRARHLILPATALALYYIAIYARLTRAAVIEAGEQDHVRTAVAKGLWPGQVVRRHVLRNALAPILTVVGMHVAGLLGGAVVTETVFSWPGMGRLVYEAVMAREYPLLLGVVLISSLLVIVVNAAVDVLQAALDPRVEVR